MSYVEHVLFTAKCDRTGCDLTFGEGDDPWPTKRGLDHDASKHGDWWANYSETGEHFCPEHWPLP